MQEENRIDQIIRSLREMNHAFYHATRKDAEESGITHIQYFVLRLLKQNPMIGLSELASHMHASPSTISGVVDRLVQAGLITRERPEHDRRSLVIKLSPEGEELLAQTRARFMERLSPILDISGDEIEKMLKVHQKIIQTLRQTGGDS